MENIFKKGIIYYSNKKMLLMTKKNSIKYNKYFNNHKESQKDKI